MYHRHKLVPRYLTAFIMSISIAGCGDSALAPEETRRGYIMAEAEGIDCLSSEPAPREYDHYSWDERWREPIEYECVDQSPPPQEHVPVRNVYGDASQLNAVLTDRMDAPTSTLVAYEQQQGFQSLRAYLDGGEEFVEGTGDAPSGNEAVALQNDGVVRADFPVGDAILSLMNTRGELQVGDTVYKVTRDNVFAVHVLDLGVLQQKVPTLSSPPPADGDPRISVSPVETTVPREGTEVLTSISGPRFHHVPGVGSVCHVYAGSSNRMRGQSYKTFWLFYTEAGVTTEWERKKKFLWWSYWGNTYQSGTLGYSFTSTLTQGQIGLPGSNPVGTPSGSFSWTGTSKVHRTLTWGIFHRIHGEIHARHTVSNSQVNGYCDTTA